MRYHLAGGEVTDFVTSVISRSAGPVDDRRARRRPGESKRADVGISLPGRFEEPVAPVFVDGASRQPSSSSCRSSAATTKRRRWHRRPSGSRGRSPTFGRRRARSASRSTGATRSRASNTTTGSCVGSRISSRSVRATWPQPGVLVRRLDRDSRRSRSTAARAELPRLLVDYQKMLFQRAARLPRGEHSLRGHLRRVQGRPRQGRRLSDGAVVRRRGVRDADRCRYGRDDPRRPVRLARRAGQMHDLR